MSGEIRVGRRRLREPLLLLLLGRICVLCVLWSGVWSGLLREGAEATASPPAANPIVQAPVGTIQGVKDPTTGASLFLGIRYAQAPVKDLRWKAPQAVAPWGNETVYNASSYGASCYQQYPENNDGSSEDCLFLNVFVPMTNDSDASLPVKIWIHGGGFVQGSSTEYPAATLAQLSQSIIVTLNYRLGNFGFFGISTLADEDPTLNWGIQDQRLAMTWVQQNIMAFGGDPQNILLFGESAGAMSVAIHLITEKSWGLYHKVLLESPAPWYTIESQPAFVHNSEVLQQSISDCYPGDLTCLRNLDAATVVALPLVNTPLINGMQGDLSTQPYSLISQGAFNKGVDVLLGNNANEGAIFVFTSAKTLTPNNTLTNDLVEEVFNNLLIPTSSKVSSEVWSIYQPIAAEKGNFEALDLLSGEFLVDCGTRNLANAFSNKTGQSSVWRYVFSHAPSNWTVDNVTLSELNATHAVELPFVFHESLFGINLDAQELELSSQIVAFWSNFHLNSNPNPQGSPGSNSTIIPIWPSYLPLDANSTIFNLNTNFGLYEETWAGRCAQLEAILYPA